MNKKQSNKVSSPHQQSNSSTIVLMMEDHQCKVPDVQ